MDMRRFVVKKLIYLSITLFAILLTNFFLFRIMPGDPVRALVTKGVSPEIIEELMHRWHLDEPIYVQFYYYLVDVVQFDFGVTTTYLAGSEVSAVILPKMVNTLMLVGVGTFIAVVVGIALGRFVAWRRGQPVDTALMAVTLTFYTMPTFLLALGILLLFGGTLEWFPLKGAYGEIPFVRDPPSYEEMSIVEKLVSRLYHMVLPALAFSIQIMADFVLIMRNSLTDVLTEDYITTARAKGLSDEVILKEHAMRNALLPVVTVMAIAIGWIVGGEIMVEIIFSYQGIGQLTWDAVNKLDFQVLQALFLIMTVGVLIANLIADVVYTYLDPRVKI